MQIRIKFTQLANAQAFHIAQNAVYTMDLEDYLVHVVPSEMPSKWAPEALKVQAVCSRTYAANNIMTRAKDTYDVDDTTSFQAFHANEEATSTDTAIKATAGQFVLYDGKPIYAVFSASNGGEVESAKQRWGKDYPYLIAEPDPWDAKAGLPKDGHGVGMSQNGANQGALEGNDYLQILAFYYPGTVLGTWDGTTGTPIQDLSTVLVNGSGTTTSNAASNPPATESSGDASTAASASTSAAVDLNGATDQAGDTRIGETGTVKVNSAGLNVRSSPDGSLLSYKLYNGAKLTVLQVAVKAPYTWYRIEDANGRTNGWVRADYVTLDNPAAQPSTTTVPSVSTDAGTTTASTASTGTAAAATTTDSLVGKMGVVKVNSAGLNVRSTPGGSLLSWKYQNGDTITVLETEDEGGYTWYRVQDAKGRTNGWIRSDFVTLNS